jgi:NADPH:quinone reductase-like Zn-dependent oxidoreductase
MKAILVVPGPQGALYEYRQVPAPAPKAGEVLVRVHATATNRGELLARPQIRSSNPKLLPTIGGIEFAGEIVALAPNVSSWKAGDRVMGRAPGSYAELVAVNQHALMRIPDTLTYPEAAAIPNVFVTAHDAIVTAAQLHSGESAMITAGSSGVGTAAIQIARYLGAQPLFATTRSAAKGDTLRALGATHAIDVSSAAWVGSVKAATNGRGVDVIIDNVGGPMLKDNLHALAVRGRLVSVGRNAGNVGECNLDELAFKRASFIGVTFRTRSTQEALACSERFASDLLGAIDRGALKPIVDRIFPFDGIADAHTYMLSDAQIGKIVLTIDSG